MIYIPESTVSTCCGATALLIMFIVMSSVFSVESGWKKGICYTVILFIAVGVVAVGLADILENIAIVKGV